MTGQISKIHFQHSEVLAGQAYDKLSSLLTAIYLCISELVKAANLI